MGKRQPPVQQPPPVQKLRIRYAKRGPARFSSHRDFGRALERALRRAGIPMAYSSGFTPHPRISYANAAPTGAASEAEYVELGLAQRCDPGKVREALNEVMPTGFEVVAVAEASPASLNDLLEASDWVVHVPGADGQSLREACEALRGREEFLVERMTKNGMRSFDVRAALLRLAAAGEELHMRILHQTPLVRPDDVLTALKALGPEIPEGGTPLLRRLRQGPMLQDAIGDPLA